MFFVQVLKRQRKEKKRLSVYYNMGICKREGDTEVGLMQVLRREEAITVKFESAERERQREGDDRW